VHSETDASLASSGNCRHWATGLGGRQAAHSRPSDRRRDNLRVLIYESYNLVSWLHQDTECDFLTFWVLLQFLYTAAHSQFPEFQHGFPYSGGMPLNTHINCQLVTRMAPYTLFRQLFWICLPTTTTKIPVLITCIAYLNLTMMCCSGCSWSAEDAPGHSVQCLSIIEYAEETMTIGS